MDAYSYATFLDFSREWTKIDVKFLEDMVQAFHSGVLEEVKYYFSFVNLISLVYLLKYYISCSGRIAEQKLLFSRASNHVSLLVHSHHYWPVT